jgi:anti-sigma regulatory factor (Ser/Thr protein kinase)
MNQSEPRMKREVSLELAADPEAALLTRAAITTSLGAELPHARLSALHTVISELVTNSVKHGSGPIRIRVEAGTDGAVLGRVEDDGEGHVAIREGVDPADGGMGLKMVDAFTDRWGVEEGTTNVWFELAPRRFPGDEH